MNLKLKITFTLMLILFSPLLAVKDFSVSIKGGYVAASLSGKGAENSSSRLETLNSFKIGVGFEIGITTLIAIHPEITYTRSGYVSEFNSNRVEDFFDYLKIPVWVKFRFSDLYIAPGVYLSFNIGSAESRLTANGVASEGISRVETVDAGIGFLVGYNFKVSKNIKIFVEGSYLLGLVSANSSAEYFNTETYIGTGVSFTINTQKKKKEKPKKVESISKENFSEAIKSNSKEASPEENK